MSPNQTECKAFCFMYKTDGFDQTIMFADATIDVVVSRFAGFMVGNTFSPGIVAAALRLAADELERK